ncbi:hypothetical protein [Salinarimonas ramus]|uniref:Uncharacterized protein n=1 Tax=Salinarimonas ramus TaxID=690164 RepID=A0A917Q4N4_9HYPH|nr:hypothetical protein [Salinarimonas ramus]GGK23244.1 hypothetical protein GCM10011322_07490 [Salinarimonas ramus]
MIRFIKYDGRQPRLVTVPRWAIGLGLVAAFLVGLLVLTLAFGIALVAVPVLLVAGGVAAWIGRGKSLAGKRDVARAEDGADADPLRPRPRGERDVIDVEYRIVDRDEKP